MASTGQSALDPGRRPLHSADDTVDRGPAYRARGHRGRIRGTTDCPPYAAYRAADTHDRSLILARFRRRPVRHGIPANVSSSRKQQDSDHYL